MSGTRILHVPKEQTAPCQALAQENYGAAEIQVRDYTGQHVATILIGTQNGGRIGYVEAYSANSYRVDISGHPGPAKVTAEEPSDPIYRAAGEPPPDTRFQTGARDSWAHYRINQLDERMEGRLKAIESRLDVMDSHTHTVTPALNPFETGGPLARSATGQ